MEKRLSKRLVFYCPSCGKKHYFIRPLTVEADIVIEIVIGVFCFFFGMWFYSYYFV